MADIEGMETITTTETKMLLASEGAQPFYFPPDGAGTTAHDAAARLPDGRVVVLVYLIQRGAYLGRVYSPGEFIAQRNRPTPYGIHGGRWSDYMRHQRACGLRALAEGASLADIVAIWGHEPPTEADITAQVERGARNRASIRR